MTLRNQIRSNSDEEEFLNIRGLLGIFRRRIGLFLSVLLLVFTLVAVVTLQMTPKYTSSASVMMELRQKEIADFEAVLSGLPPESAAVDTEVEIIESRAMVEKVCDSLNLYADEEFNPNLKNESGFQSIKDSLPKLFTLLKPVQVAPEPNFDEAALRAKEKVVSAVSSKLNVRRAGLTYVIKISFESENPAKSARIANEFADQYLVSQFDAKFEATSRANDWLNDRLSALREEVRVDENAVELYRAQSGLLSAEGSSLTEQQISDLTAQLVIQRAEFEESKARLDSVQAQVSRGASAETIGEVLTSEVIRELRSQQAEVTRRRAELSSRYGSRHPEILKVEREAADIQAQIDQEIRRIVSNLESEVEVDRQKVGSLERSLGQLKAELASNNQSLVQLREFERNAEASRSLYESFLSRFKETGEQESLTEADARIISRAALPTNPSSPNTILNLALGVLLGGVAGAAMIFLIEMMDSGLRTGAQVESDLGVPFIASVPTIKSGMVDSLKRLAGAEVSPQDYLVEKPLSSFAESYRALRSSILLSNVDHQTKIVTITSALPGEGKTTSAFCLGRMTAMSGARVLIVDCDLRRRLLSKTWKSSDDIKNGLVQYLLGEAKLSEVIFKDDLTDCEILPLAKVTYTPTDIFGSTAFKNLIVELRKAYDLIIFDSAPILPVADTRTLAHLSDAVVIVAKWRQTKRDAVASAIKLVDDVGGNLSGVLLTQVNQRARNRYGQGDEGYYYPSYRKYYVD
ncbi:MAG: capsular biosynthesis protein [Ponticaulis sp.]|nr:capsular biosynthesis protein [Ponticaulis sp.]